MNEFSLKDLKLLRTLPLHIGHEGWGLALDPDGSKLYLTDSTDALYHLDSSSYAELAKLKIVDPRLSGADGNMGAPFAIHGVNELEMVDGELWGNVYPMYQNSHSECIVRINATTGAVIGWIDMHGLLAKQRSQVRAQPHSLVLNGIAYHAKSGRLYVTGKQWDKMYQVRIKPAPNMDHNHVLRHCGLGNVKHAHLAENGAHARRRQQEGTAEPNRPPRRG